MRTMRAVYLAWGAQLPFFSFFAVVVLSCVSFRPVSSCPWLGIINWSSQSPGCKQLIRTDSLSPILSFCFSLWALIKQKIMIKKKTSQMRHKKQWRLGKTNWAAALQDFRYLTPLLLCVVIVTQWAFWLGCKLMKCSDISWGFLRDSSHCWRCDNEFPFCHIWRREEKRKVARKSRLQVSWQQ